MTESVNIALQSKYGTVKRQKPFQQTHDYETKSQSMFPNNFRNGSTFNLPSKLMDQSHVTQQYSSQINFHNESDGNIANSLSIMPKSGLKKSNLLN